MHHRAAPVIDPSEELIGVANVFLRWYKLFRQTTPGKTAAEINILRSLGKYLLLSLFISFTLFALCILYQLLTLLHLNSGCWAYSKRFFHTATN